jgi:hypothetical protein
VDGEGQGREVAYISDETSSVSMRLWVLANPGMGAIESV